MESDNYYYFFSSDFNQPHKQKMDSRFCATIFLCYTGVRNFPPKLFLNTQENWNINLRQVKLLLFIKELKTKTIS